ncbi:thyroglobulin isoform 1 [Tropilaelaps mercedesae]|uniref:Thyroglobulin isoform 1 n=1 Tax=Tropilaelaps mercedesae TaxID=418985 RepID=A0A1V9XXK8_9ACAR|nr:thyroglobulin isoform 1 [Tropilaelaps mercedesae]
MKAVILAVLLTYAAASCMDERTTAIAEGHDQRPGGFVPTCIANGNWAPRQCQPNTGMCHCRLPDGIKINEGSRELRYCECPIENYRKTKRGLLGVHRPKCQKNGLFEKIQCHEGYCYCADESTGKRVSEFVVSSSHCELQC